MAFDCARRTTPRAALLLSGLAVSLWGWQLRAAEPPAPPVAAASGEPAPAAAADPVAAPDPALAVAPVQPLAGAEVYDALLAQARQPESRPHFEALTAATLGLSWAQASRRTLEGNLRRLQLAGGGDFYLLRARTGDLFVLALPPEAAALAAGSGSPYAGLAGMIKDKLTFTLESQPVVVAGTGYQVVRLVEPPVRGLLDRLFFVAIILLLFLTMVGMGITLTTADFGVVFKKPLGMIVGLVAQFGLMPLLALAIGKLTGFYEQYPFIYLGFILIAATPGGVTSNLMTYFGKGDVALSVSLTAVCTVLALLFTPLLLVAYGGNIPAFTIPVSEVFRTILVLVLVPLAVGMLLRAKAPGFARRAEKPFAALGLLALLFLIVVGISSNLDQFADTQRYGVKFYASVFVLTLAGMAFGALFAKLGRVGNFQVRAISLEVGLRNASLAMTIAILLQDRIGDFASSMFFTSGIFGLCMYLAGAIFIFLFPRLLPVAAPQAEVAAERPAA